MLILVTACLLNFLGDDQLNFGPNAYLPISYSPDSEYQSLCDSFETMFFSYTFA
jgi:hypothetical protein